MHTPLSRASARIRHGFTLIELLAVIMIIGILAFFLVPKIPEAIDNTRVTACKKNMQDIYQGLLAYKMKFDRSPRESGVKFFAELIPSRVWDNTVLSAKKLNCPAVDPGALPGIADKPEEEWFKDLTLVDGDCSAYAGRDCKTYPMKSFPPGGKEPLVCDDNQGGMNHRSATVVLYGDGTAQTIELYTLEQQGLITEDEEVLMVGEGSPVEALHKFSLD